MKFNFREMEDTLQDLSSEDEMGFVLSEHLRLHKATGHHSKKATGSKPVKHTKNHCKKKQHRDYQSSSSSSNDQEPGGSNDFSTRLPHRHHHHHNKKRQNVDKNWEPIANPKRACLGEPKLSEWQDGHGIHNPSQLTCRAQTSNQRSLFPDKTYEEHLNISSDEDLTPEPRRQVDELEFHPDSFESEDLSHQPHRNRLQSRPVRIDSSDDEIAGLLNGALVGGRQSPESSICRKAIRHKVKKILDSDSEDSNAVRNSYRRHAVIFSSSDSDFETGGISEMSKKSKDFHRFRSREPVLCRIDPPKDSADYIENPALPSSSSCQYRGAIPRRGRSRLATSSHGTQDGSADFESYSPRRHSLRTSCLHAEPSRQRKGLRRSRGSYNFQQSNLATAYRNTGLPVNGDSSEVEFFTANTYSDAETSAESLGSLSIRAVSGGRKKHHPNRDEIVDTTDHTVDSSEDEISVVFSTQPSMPVMPTEPLLPMSPIRPRLPVTRRRTTPRTLGRRYTRGPRRRLSSNHDLVPLSPDPVEQVRQVEEDERFARMLQAQFDSEDLTFMPPDPAHHPPQEDEMMPICAGNPFINMNPLFQYPNFLSDLDTIRLPEAFRQVRGTRRRRAHHPVQPPSIMHSHGPIGMRLMTVRNYSTDDNSYESLISLIETNGDVVTHGMQKTEIGRLPTRKYVVPNGAGPSDGPMHRRTELNKECQVCLSDYIDGDVLRILPCFHEFHTPCIDPWLKINHTCPVCRVVVNLDDYESFETH